ncbi:YafY family transcriptional regulator [Natronospirillum operosum]|uniref:YafY family transcriptional regulator n=1 Tax=Natronospirillum operosum TaxID=2759953 RepID=A0A4Z0W4S1_9GAMM|nr:YafY family protein [Natronospirillum operosum]TGG91681.1 YafY family transcriptional regulator [Natronospirillum operosum]
MRKSDRLFQMTNLIRSRQPLFARTLAEEMGLSVRTIYRYIDDLSAAGIPVYYDDGQGYRLLDGFELPPLAVTQEEFDALVTGVKLVRSWTGARMSEAAASLLHKMEATARGPALDLLFENVISPVMFERTVEAGYWDSVKDAIRQGTALQINYRDGQQQLTERMVHPLNLSFWGSKWTLGAWCHQRHDYRDFRLDRIEALQAAEDAPPLPPGVTLAAYLRSISQKEAGTAAS